MKPVTVRVTHNFSQNLEAIEEFLHEAEAADAFKVLLDDLFSEVIPALESFPDLGADFFRHRAASHEAMSRAQQLRHRLGPETNLRELIRGAYLLLYAHRNQEIFLLAIRHHRQLSFDLPEHWPD